MTRAPQSNLAATRWSIRIIPLFIFAAFGVATYVVPARLCINYLYRDQHESGAATALLVLYFLFFILTLASYTRLVVAVQRNPALVPISADREENEKGKSKQHGRRSGRGRDVEAQPWVPPDENPDSPGLEAFYSKRVFVCETDGRPKWCSECRQWKPDRAHHSSEMGQCVRKMDHLCPWVGGMVCETSFNYFIQFTAYCTIYCAVCLATTAYCLNKQLPHVDGWTVAVIALAGFFIMFTFGMVMTSGRFVLTNTTNIDMLKRSNVTQLAVRIPRGSPSTVDYPTISYPLASNSWWPSNDNLATRDQQATHTFAIVRTSPSENIWDLGPWGNFKSVMGNNIVEWLLPIASSPCCNHDSMESDYELGPLLAELKKRFNIPEETEQPGSRGEMREIRADRQ